MKGEYTFNEQLGYDWSWTGLGTRDEMGHFSKTIHHDKNSIKVIDRR
jgi:hypothetical protein